MKKAAILFTFIFTLVLLPTANLEAKKAGQYDDPIQQGEYIAYIAGCVSCHSRENPETGEFIPETLFAGGNPFDLGPLGIVFSKNLTSDPETGLGNWSDEEIKTAVRTGISPDGLHLFPVMPYPLYNGMAESDLDALVAFLRTLPPVNNPLPRDQILPPEALPQLPIRADIIAPEPADTAARANYLFAGVLPCADCHTPIDQETGAPIPSLYLSGGQPFEGPWGIIYGGNITPDDETGIGTWSDEDIKRIFHSGVRPDGRQVVLMPWRDFQPLTDEDLDAVVYYLRNIVPAVNREVSAPALNESFINYVEVPSNTPAIEPANNVVPIIMVVVALGLMAAGAVFVRR
ncbi:MAG: cytochrome c [Ardenticatenaceae bacterium]|nr:cytochrome c [Ardenticatenaceae bacterium]